MIAAVTWHLHMLTQERPGLVAEGIERLVAAATGDRAAA